MKCPNCEAPIERIDGFCWNCGQKNKDGRITLSEFFKDILENVLNIDAKVFRTIGHLFIPGKLSNRYFDGKRQQYFSPFRIFFVTAIFHFGVLSFIGSRSIDDDNAFSKNDMVEKGYWDSFRHKLDTARNEVLKSFPGNEEVPAALDSLYRQLPDYSQNTRYLTYMYLDENWNIKNRAITLTYEELMRYTPQQLVEKYEVKGWISQVQFQQVVKLNKDGKNFILFLVKNLLWMVVVMMAALALTLKLLYIRKNRYLIEHLVFAFHYHSFAFIIITIAVLLDFWLDTDTIMLWGFLAVLIYLFIAMRRFYKQGRFKTFIKFTILNFSYLFIFAFFIGLTFVVSIFIF